jgi:hypothetical protein
LENKNADIVVSMNYPLRESGEIDAIHNPDTAALLAWIDTAPGLSDLEKTLRDIVTNFEILDWTLFDLDDDDE